LIPVQGRGSHEQTYLEEVHPVQPSRNVSRRPARDRLFRHQGLLLSLQTGRGDGWVLIGDAFGFLDPLYSSGVLLPEVRRAGRGCHRRGTGPWDVSAGQLGKWGPLFNKGVDRMRRLVCEYYDGFSFGQFVRTFPQLKGSLPIYSSVISSQTEWTPPGADGVAIPAGEEKSAAVDAEAPPEVAQTRLTSCSFPVVLNHESNRNH